MAPKPSVLLLLTLVHFGGVSFTKASQNVTSSSPSSSAASSSSEESPKSSVHYHNEAELTPGKGDWEEAEESKPRGRRQSYSYGATQRPVSYHEEYNSPPYYYESNNPPQSYHHEYHSPPQSYHVDYNERPRNHHQSYNSPPQHHRSSYNNHDSNEYHDGHPETYHNDNEPYGHGGGGGGDGGYHGDDSGGEYGENDYENSPSNRFEREIRGEERRRSPREEFTGRFNLEY